MRLFPATGTGAGSYTVFLQISFFLRSGFFSYDTGIWFFVKIMCSFLFVFISSKVHRVRNQDLAVCLSQFQSLLILRLSFLSSSV